MRVAIAGGHGKIALRLTRLLSDRGDEVISLIRNPDHSTDVEAVGGKPVICDLERAGVDEMAEAIRGADAVVFAAGAGPGSGSERKETMDYGGAVKLIEAARVAGVARYLMVSSRGANPDQDGDDTFSVYLRAKGRADEALKESGLGYVIVRPGMLTDDLGTGHVQVGDRRGQISRDDVAAVLAFMVSNPDCSGWTFGVTAGDMAIEELPDLLAR
jgi:nucleoside-diphosphate-sugar epimerase